jgi:uncharacterized protein YbjT (DUF2867 family)
MSKTAIIAGASGLIGSELLNQLLSDDSYERIIAVGRKPLEIENERLQQKVIDFEELSVALKEIRAQHAYCCLGTTIRKAGSKERQYHIDHDYVVEFAKACYGSGVTRFAVVSSSGADNKSGNFYLRTKGEMEEDIKKVPFEGVFIFRPSILLGRRKEFRFGEIIAKGIIKLINPLMVGSLRRYRGIYDSIVASGMINAVKSASLGIRIIESDKI